MIVFPNCKINLGLRIVRKRNDGHHDLETVFYPLPLNDVLEIVPYRDKYTSSIPFTTSGLSMDTDSVNNLCVKAYRLLKKEFPSLSHIQMHLHKVIPLGGGIGGGSSDAAFTLRVLNDEFNLGLSTEELIQYALQIGSDCPFFIINKPCMATGRGELLEIINLDLSSYKIILVNPAIHINTGVAFRSIFPSTPEKSIKEIISRPIEKWKDELVNDFEKYCFKQYPAIVDVKDQLYVAGAIYASMSGSGSTVYGIFQKEKTVQLKFPSNYFVKELIG